MLRLLVPPSLRRLSQPRVVPGSNSLHVGLEYDLVEALRPGLVVDLGTGDGTSFFACCQSMHDHGVDGLAYAIDAWTEPPAHPEASLDAQRAHARARYAGFTYFVEMPPHQALRHFAEGSVDLLRLDGTRPDVIAGADVEAWYRRVRPGGVIAWHGAEAEGTLWPLVAGRCRSVVFTGGRGGLGLALKPGPASPPPFLELLLAHGELAGLEAFYAHVHAHHELLRLHAALRPPGEGKP